MGNRQCKYNNNEIIIQRTKVKTTKEGQAKEGGVNDMNEETEKIVKNDKCKLTDRQRVILPNYGRKRLA